MAARNQGIQMLLAAEKEANEKVAEAKKRKVAKLKQAKDEATEEIKLEKAKFQAVYEDREKQVQGDRADAINKMNQNTDHTIKQQEDTVNKNKGMAIDMLLNWVFDIEPEYKVLIPQQEEVKFPSLQAFCQGRYLELLDNCGSKLYPHDLFRGKLHPCGFQLDDTTILVTGLSNCEQFTSTKFVDFESGVHKSCCLLSNCPNSNVKSTNWPFSQMDNGTIFLNPRTTWFIFDKKIFSNVPLIGMLRDKGLLQFSQLVKLCSAPHEAKSTGNERHCPWIVERLGRISRVAKLVQCVVERSQSHFRLLILLMLTVQVFAYTFTTLHERVKLPKSDHLFGLFYDTVSNLLHQFGTGNVLGWKINRPFAGMLTRFFSFHLFAWHAYVTQMNSIFLLLGSLIVEYTPSNVLSYALFPSIVLTHAFVAQQLVPSSKTFSQLLLQSINQFVQLLLEAVRLLIAFLLSFLLDLVSLYTLHFTCFYVYALKLMRVQILCVNGSWRLCKSGTKWNPLRNRYDTAPDHIAPLNWKICPVSGKQISGDEEKVVRPSAKSIEYHDSHLDRLFIATTLGLATALCLMPTTLAFYSTFVCIHLVFVFIEFSLSKILFYTLDVPCTVMCLWLFHHGQARTKPVMTRLEPFGNQPQFFRLDITREDFIHFYRLHHLIDDHKMFFNKDFTVSSILRNVFTVQLI
ncbi:V-type proton ATPase catalytic subunit A [Cichlidogyrus casuarinus]|uniref:V-type proton ATPase catalytic subunit A n=1 Tax=Cichlidogyrus casuarinus TaxID=1844966 RepID=A0ABD2Q2F8_9PLAT